MKINGEWKIRDSQEIYKNPWIKLREDKVIQPGGKSGIFSVVEMLDGVCILPLDESGYVYLIEQFRYTLGCNTIEAPGGALNKGEDVLESAKKELKEETGILAQEFINLGKILPLTAVIKTTSILFLAKKLKFTEALLEETEQIKVVKMKLEDAQKMVMENKIYHAPTCVLLLKAIEYLRL